MPRRAAQPNCYIIAGADGAGKTTFATEFLPLHANCRNFINPDLLARAYSPFDPDAGMLQAGRAVLERIAEFTKARQGSACTCSTYGFPVLNCPSDTPRLIFKEEAGQTSINDAALYQQLRGQFPS